MKAYIAGPLFNEGERYWNEEINRRVAAAGFKTFVPQRDGTALKSKEDVEIIFKEDIANIANSDIVVANLNGIAVDSGTAWELGHASAKGIYTIGLFTDWRLHFEYQTVNLMMMCSLDELLTSIDDLGPCLEAYQLHRATRK